MFATLPNGCCHRRCPALWGESKRIKSLGNKIMPRASRGRPLGAENKDKPYREALRMEIAAADDFKGLRAIARAHLDKARSGDIAAIKELADRLDGKPAQESTVSINDVRDNMTDAELRTFIASAIAGTLSGGNGAAEPDDQVVTH